MAHTNGAAYDLHGSLLEACSCGVLCPCWIGQDPDTDGCDAFNAYRVERGTIDGVDVSGLSFVRVVRIPGNVLDPGSWIQVVFVDDRATEDQERALLAARRGPIVHETVDGKGTLKVGDGTIVDALMHPFVGPDGSTTTLRDSLFSTVPGSPAYVGVADHNRVDLPEHGMQWSFEGRNAIQADWHLTYGGGVS